MKSIVRRHNKTNVKMSRKNKTHKKSSIKRTRTNKYTRMRRRKNRIISKKKIYKGGNNDITCCMCGDKNLTRENTLVPSKCFTEHWNRAHRICEKKCWFQKFAKEGNNHTCPGCIKELPLTNVESTFPNQVIDLTKN
tara:strand:+ start:1614 stop:2024 length:411 start_codon:yes stop_codon:yes gene_type:complete